MEPGSSRMPTCIRDWWNCVLHVDALGGVDGFDEDEAEGEGNDGAVVLGRLLAAERHTLEPLQLAHKLLDAGAGAIERLWEEPRPVPG